jgi:alanyl-tRNA synthetase
VRVIRVHNWDENISVELCWGTHVVNTKDIWAFAIISQEAVASWIKRITAYTWPKVIEKLHNYEEILDWATSLLDVKSYAQINEKLQKFVKENTDLQQRVESLETSSLRWLLQSSNSTSNEDFSKIIELPSDVNFKALQWIIKAVFPTEKSVLLFSAEGNYVISTDWSVSAKEFVKKHWLRWGGSDLIAQWKDEWVLKFKN